MSSVETSDCGASQDQNQGRHNRVPWIRTMVAVVGVAVIGLSVWEFVVWLFDLPQALLPTPRAVALAAKENREALVGGFLTTGLAASVGLITAVIVGSGIGIVFSLSRGLRMALFPYVIFLQTMPIVSIAPLLIIWSGYHFRTVVIVTVIICLFPIVNSVTSGLLSIQRDLADLFQLYGASRIQKLIRLQIPSAIGHLMIGTKTSAGLAVIGAIVAEFFVGSVSQENEGLGTLMTKWQTWVKTDALIAALFASAFLGLILFGLVSLISKTALKRWTTLGGRNEP